MRSSTADVRSSLTRWRRPPTWQSPASGQRISRGSLTIQPVTAVQGNRFTYAPTRSAAWSAFRWFMGGNDLQISLYDPATGGLPNMKIAVTVDHHKTRGDQTVDEDLKFCLSALARGNSLAMQGQLESATRDFRAVEDTAGTVKKALRLLPAAAGLSLLKASSATESTFVTLIALDGHKAAT